jgi:hypothetical protein
VTNGETLSIKVGVNNNLEVCTISVLLTMCNTAIVTCTKVQILCVFSTQWIRSFPIYLTQKKIAYFARQHKYAEFSYADSLF